MKTTYITCAETAKLIRKALKAAFPTIKFSVTSKTYSGGASIRVRWVDGPTTKDVEAVAKVYQGQQFDGMIDMATSNRHWLLPDGSVTFADTQGTEGSRGTIPAEQYDAPHPDAVKVHFLADYVFCERAYSVEFLRRRAESIARKYHIDVPEVKASSYDGHGYVVRTGERLFGGYETADELVMKAAQRCRGVY